MKAAAYGRKTLNELLVTAAESFPGRGTGFVQSDGSISFISYSELLSRAKSLSAGLQDRGMKPGETVMIVMTRNENLIPVIWGCILGRFIPTILQPPVSFTEFNQPALKIENVYRLLHHPKVILSSDLLQTFSSGVISQDHLLNADELEGSIRETGPDYPDENDTAYIQFSSGSTGDPKGIVLTHKNILTNLAAISIGLDIHDMDIMTSWMPLYHDMGFFGYHLTPVLGQCNHYLIDPVDFIKKPVIWLDTMEQLRCTITGCPNFGQALLLRYLRNKPEKTWDLSSLKAIVNGAEPISTRVMSEFMTRLVPSRLKPEAMMPAYGMAEATLAITFSELLLPPIISSFNRQLLQQKGIVKPETGKASDIIDLVSVGKALDDIEIRLVDEDGSILGEMVEGHIQIKGAGITRGYYDNPSETRQSFDQGWLKTGDKGFYFEDHLYITGRVKDIIFLRGQNLYAHDLENLAGKYTDTSYSKIIIGGWFDQKKGQDQIVLFIVGMINRATAETCMTLRSFFRDSYGITIDIFVPLRSNQVPKTSSGKIQRYKLLTGYQNGEYSEALSELGRLIKELENQPKDS